MRAVKLMNTDGLKSWGAQPYVKSGCVIHFLLYIFLLSYMFPAPLKDDLHLIHKAILARLFLLRQFTPRLYSAMHQTLLEPWCRRPPQYPILPHREIHIQRRHACICRMHSIVCGHVIPNFDAWVEKDAFGSGSWIIGMDQATF